MGYQAITTRYIGPSNKRGSRIKATAAAGFVYHEYDDALSSEQNHNAAAKKLAAKYGWRGRYLRGGLANGDSVYVADDPIPGFVIF